MKVNETWHNLEVPEVLASLDSKRDGLSQEEAQRRLAQFGHNELAAGEKV